MSEDVRLLRPMNRTALISLGAAVLTLLSLCTAVAPIPFTGYVCYPAAALLGLVAMVAGMSSLGQMKTRNEDGRTYAWIGIWIGGLATLASACAIGAGILLYPRVISLIQHYLHWQ